MLILLAPSLYPSIYLSLCLCLSFARFREGEPFRGAFKPRNLVLTETRKRDPTSVRPTRARAREVSDGIESLAPEAAASSPPLLSCELSIKID